MAGLATRAVSTLPTAKQIRNQNLIEKTLSDFGIEIETIKATVGPTITLYEIVPKAGTKISRIQSLEKDIMMSLSALGIRIIAPIPGKGTVGIEVPNKNRQTVSMYSVISSIALPAGCGPRHLVFDDSGTHVFCLTELGSDIYILDYSDGKLVQIGRAHV